MQDGVRKQGMWNKVEQTLSGMGRWEKLVLGMNVSLRWHSIVVMNLPVPWCNACNCDMWVQVSPGVFVCICM